MEYMDETTLAHKHTSPWLIAFRIIFTIALVWCILFIFHNSLETSSISSARSHEVMQKIRVLAAKERRSINMQLCIAVESYLNQYEQEHGEIPVPAED